MTTRHCAEGRHNQWKLLAADGGVSRRGGGDLAQALARATRVRGKVIAFWRPLLDQAPTRSGQGG